MSELGHVVFYVRDLEASVRFYNLAVGLNVIGRIFNGRGALLTGGRTHHELLLIQVGDAAGPLQGKRIGLYHTGWKVGDDLSTLRDVHRRVLDAGFEIEGLADHTISQSIYLKDPDGNEVELYVDDRDVDWRHDRAWINEPVKPLALSAQE
ncbi:MAG: VOC family protein [Gammaproteobacteria bacterium]|nr:VOC family protein [Gammaproteobacteria bacterium]